MSAETMEWLNFYTLQSRRVWHTDDQLQKIAHTIYDGRIPVEDVATRLFGWEPLEATKLEATAVVITPEGVEEIVIPGTGRKVTLRPPGALGPEDQGAWLGVFKKGYKSHSYKTWLLDKVAEILDDELGIYSAGLLRQGALAWVQVTVPDTIMTPEGVVFRPNLLCVTSLDGSIVSTYKRTIGNAVCDNTLSGALGELGPEYRVKHTANSEVRLLDARSELELFHQMPADFAAAVARLTAVKVSKTAWRKYLDVEAPLIDINGDEKTGRSLTLAQNKRDQLDHLYIKDPRCAPWTGTAYGVIQTQNTYAHHYQTVRGNRDERNMSHVIFGGFDQVDRKAHDTILSIVG